MKVQAACAAAVMRYSDGKTSALINLQDPLHVTIVTMTHA